MWYRAIFLFPLLHQLLALDSDVSLDVEISMPDDCDAKNGTIHLFCIEAKLDEGSVYRIMHRYNDFHTLNKRLGELAHNKFDNAPFPGKFEGAWCFWNQDCERDRVNKRRNALQMWLQRVLKDPESKGRWKVPLQEFLHPEAKVGTRTIDGLKHDALSIADKVMTHAKSGMETIKEKAQSGIKKIKAKDGMPMSFVRKVTTHAKSGLETIKENAKSGIESIKDKVAGKKTDL
jgi:hypothetical protein